MSAKLVNANKGDGKLYSVTLQLTDKDELRIFRKLIESDLTACPHCGDPITGTDQCMLKIDAPLAKSPIGIEIAMPIIRCDNCGQEITLSMVDYTPFKSAVNFIQQLRLKYNRMQREGKA